MATRAALVVPCTDLGAAIDFFCRQLGFRVERISPADDPQLAIVSGHEMRICLDRSTHGPPPRLCIEGKVGPLLRGPDGIVVERIAPPSMVVPDLAAELTVLRNDPTRWIEGRAGMLYRDLIPGRHGGRFAASHIRIEEGGAVPDYVHFHTVRFQVIYCRVGSVEVVYEGQGAPFLLLPGDCVLQPPQIRHRVLHAAAGTEVIELSCPAHHDTFGDLERELPDEPMPSSTAWSGQRFVRHIAANAKWGPWRMGGWSARDCGIASATAGLGSVVVARASEHPQSKPAPCTHSGELLFFVLLCGGLDLECPDPHSLQAGDAISVPAAVPFRLTRVQPATELLEIAVG